MNTLTANDKKTIAELALSTAIALIQKKMGIETGDVAGVFFDGSSYGEQITDMFVEYIDTELAMK